MNLPDLPDSGNVASTASEIGEVFIHENIDQFNSLFEDLPDPRIDESGFKREFSNRMNDFQAKLNLDHGSPMESFGREFGLDDETIKWAVTLEQLLGLFATNVVGYIDKQVKEAYTERLPDAPPMLIANDMDNPLAALLGMIGAADRVTSQDPDDIKRRVERLKAEQNPKPIPMSEDEIEKWLNDIPETDGPSED